MGQGAWAWSGGPLRPPCLVKMGRASGQVCVCLGACLPFRGPHPLAPLLWPDGCRLRLQEAPPGCKGSLTPEKVCDRGARDLLRLCH